MTTTPTPAELLGRWDRQQSAYIHHRDARFEALLSTLELTVGPRARVLDLACGPGSLTAAAARRLPEATITAVDKDPVLLAIARDTVGLDPRVTVLDADLTEEGWADDLDLGSVDAVVSSTALHWLHPADLTRLYLVLAEGLPEGAVFMDADHLGYDPISNPTLADVARRDDELTQSRTLADGADSWDVWWEAAESRPEYADAVVERQRRWAGKQAPPPKVTLGFHLEALRSAGFTETGTVWQHLDDYVVFARK